MDGQSQEGVDASHTEDIVSFVLFEVSFPSKGSLGHAFGGNLFFFLDAR
jgi:hypothetical protein